MKNKSFKATEIFIGTFLIIVLLVIASLLVNLLAFKHNANIYNQYVALGTLLLALVTGFLAFFSWRSIQENIKKEKRDREERLRYEIRDWARSTIRLLSKPSQPDLSPQDRIIYIKDSLHIIKTEMLTALVNAEVVGGELKGKTISAGNIFIQLNDAVWKPDPEVLTDCFMKQVLSSFDEVIKSATNMRVNDSGYEPKEHQQMAEINIGEELVEIKGLIKISGIKAYARGLITLGLSALIAGFAYLIKFPAYITFFVLGSLVIVMGFYYLFKKKR